MLQKKRCLGFWSVMLFCILLPVFTITVHAEEEEAKKVRVGYMIYDGYQNGGEGEVKSGSSYEYFQKIRYYTNWEYEYVYGSLSEMLELLERGEIDIMSSITYSEERAEKYFYSEESHGSETYYLYIHADDNEIVPSDLKTLAGKTVGVTSGSYQETYLRAWCKKVNIFCNIVTYEYIDDLRMALTNREVDAIVDVRILAEEKGRIPWKSIYRFTSEPLYFIVSKSRPDLLQELNDAQAYIVSTDEYYGYETMKKYHDGVNYHNAYLTKKQEKYLEEHGVIKVGYLEGTNPLAFTDPVTGKMSGLCAEYLDIMTAAYEIKFETCVYYDENQLIRDLIAGKVDIIFPLGMGYWAAEQAGITLSTSICNLPMTAIYQSLGEKHTFEKIAVNQYSPTQEGYAIEHYPEAEIYYVKNTEEALKAVTSGAADVYFVRSSSLEYMNQNYNIYEEFRTMSVRNDMEAFMATRNDETTLAIILDKGISLLTDTQRDAAKFRYTYAVGKASLWDVIKDNAEFVIGMGLIVVLICVLIVILSRLQINKVHVKNLEKEKDKAEKAERAKTEFLSHMSHDIRTPMNAIIGFTNFIKEETDVEKIKQDYIPKMELASNHLLMLINDVLEMSRIDTGRLVFQRDIHDIRDIAESVLTVMRMQAKEKGLTLISDISVTDGIVNCDQNHLSRVIMNLLSNAVKFTPAGGTVKLSLHQQPNAPEGYLAYEIKVSDTGIGMKPEFLQHVFEPFERERTSTVSGMQGTGLGMAIVKRIVDTAGDDISVESELGKGTMFTLNVTLIAGSAVNKSELKKKDSIQRHHSLEELKRYFKGRRILLVEDNEFNSTIANVILENAGFLVETAENGQEAVHMVINAPVPDYYDVILMDIQMPVMNGYEATKAIRKLEDERSKVNIIAVTANAFESDKSDAREAGMNGHVSKPIDVDVLYNVLLDITEVKED